MNETLPNGWRMARLGEIAQVVSGSTPRTNVAEYWDGDILWLTPADLSNLGSIVIDNSKRKITKAGFQSCTTTMLPVGTVLLSSRAPIGHLAVAGKEMCTNQGFKSLVPSKATNSYYLYFALRQFKDRLVNLGSGATFKEVSKKPVENFRVPLPPLPTQHKIVEILKEADNLRKLRKQADEKMKDLIPSLFVEMFGDPATNPKGWEILLFVNITKVMHRYPTFYGQEYIEEGVPVVRISNIQSNHILSKDLTQYVKVPKEFSGKFPLTIMNSKDIVMAVRGDTTGKIGFVPDELTGSNISPNLIRISSDSSKVNPYYLFSFLLMGGSNLKRFITDTAKKSITAKDLKSMFIIVPPLPLQQEFAERVQESEAEKERQAESKKKLDDIFNSLMQRAFKGELVA